MRYERERSKLEYQEYNLRPLIESYVFQQLKELRANINEIKPNKLTSTIHKEIDSKLPLLIKYIKLELGIRLNTYQIGYLRKDCMEASENIHEELLKIKIEYLEKEKTREESEENLNQVITRVNLERELFSSEGFTQSEENETVISSTVEEQIDGLLNAYSNWEGNREKL